MAHFRLKKIISRYKKTSQIGKFQRPSKDQQKKNFVIQENSSILSISNTISIDAENRLALRQAGRIVNLTYTSVAPALPQIKPCTARVRHDVATDRFLRIGAEHRSTVHLRYYL